MGNVRSGRFLVLLVVVHLGEFRVDDILLLARSVAARRSSTPGRGALLRLLVHCFAELHRSLRQGIRLGRDRGGVVAFERLFEVRQRILDRAPVAFAHFRAMLGQRPLGRMNKRLGMVLRFDFGLATEKALSEHGSKVGETERRAIENAMADLKEALKGSDASAITAKTNALQQASMKLGEAMYKQAAEQPAGGADGDAGAEAKKDDVVDAEFTEVDDDKKNKKSA